MSLILYWNGQRVDLDKSQTVARTLQINDLAKLSDRQANYTNKFKAPFTANNLLIFKHLGLPGSNSNVPYQKNVVKLFDESGECLIYEGWGKVNSTMGDYYDISVYDGIVDFYKAIENKNLTEIGISDLNHLKNIANVVESFNDQLAYKYIVADYNGKAMFDGKLNIDYLVPSARVSYIWERVHAYAGFTFVGSIFQTEKFKNFWKSYPKPVPINTPVTIAQTEQQSQIVEYPQTYTTEFGGIFYGANYIATILPNTFDTDQANNTAGYILIEQTGAYRIKCAGSLTNNFGTDGIVNWSLRDSANTIISEGTIDGAISQTVVINATAGNRLRLIASRQGQNAPNIYNPLSGAMITTMDLLLGYDANFDEVLVDFQAKDFVNEIMQHFGLTAFKDKYTNNIEYLTLDEILQNENTLNWSRKFCSKISEKSTIGSYAQKNLFKYKYNEENDTHKNGFIKIDDVNLSDETTVIDSKIYAPEKLKNQTFIGLGSNIYKIWNKEVKDNGDINYKELSGRFYFLRADQKQMQLQLVSENLNTSQTVSSFPFESDYRLSLQQVIFDNYISIASILDKAKVIEAYFFLDTLDIQNFDFKKLIYVEQLGSYYLVNKINNYIKGQKTKAEIIEVDYFKELVVPEPDAEIIIGEIGIENCTVTIDVVTNIQQPVQVQIIPYTMGGGVIGDFYWQPFPMPDIIYGTLENNQVSFLCDFLPYSYFGYRFIIKYVDDVFNEISTQMSEAIQISEDCYDPPYVDTDCDPTGITVTNIWRQNAGFPTPNDNGSLWGITYNLVGVTPEAVCTPYKIRIEINSSFGLQVYTSINLFTPPASIVFNLPHRPTNATVRIFFINPDLVEFPSPLYNYPI